MASPQQQKVSKSKPFLGKSSGAKQRRDRSRRGKLHTGEHARTFMIGATVYSVAKDGSFRRGRALPAALTATQTKLFIETPGGQLKQIANVKELEAHVA